MTGVSTERKRIVFVTHYNPDLDGCVAIWLLKKFGFPQAEHIIKFVPMGGKLPCEEVRNGDEVIYVDTSGGKYDHHETEEYVSSASMAMKEVAPTNDVAIERMVDYALAVDHGKVLNTDVSTFDLVNIIEGLNRVQHREPGVVVDIVICCLDGIYRSLTELIEAERELEKAVFFTTRWGKGAGAVTSNRKTRYLAHRQGIKVFVYVDEVSGYRGFTASGDSPVDFSVLAERIRGLEPEADWYLHTSRRLLLCGSGKAPNRKLSSMPLERMIDLVKV